MGRGHVRAFYGPYLFTQEEKLAWNGCFRTEEEAYRILETLRPYLPANLKVDDQIAYGKTEEGRKANRRSELIQILLAAVIVAVLAVIARMI